MIYSLFNNYQIEITATAHFFIFDGEVANAILKVALMKKNFEFQKSINPYLWNHKHGYVKIANWIGIKIEAYF